MRSCEDFLDSVHCAGANVVVAVSGGVDSVVMLHVLHRVAHHRHLTLTVAHVNHLLRGAESDADEQFVHAFADSLHLRFISTHVDVQTHSHETGKGIEASARELRYAFFQQVASETRSAFVAVGHTADDVAETLIMNIARGSGIEGVSSHPAHRALTKSITLIRPLYRAQRNDVREYAHLHGLHWREDTTNSDLHFLRNRIRSEVMPALRSIFGTEVSKRMTETSEHMGQARSIVDASTRDAFDRCARRSPEDVSLVLARLINETVPVQTQIIRAAIRLATHHAPSLTETQRIIALVKSHPGSLVSMSHGFVAVRERDSIVIVKDAVSKQVESVVIEGDGTYVSDSQKLMMQTATPDAVTIEYDTSTASMDARAISGPVVWRAWHNGDRIVPFGMQESVLVSDILTNAKVPSRLKRSARVLSDDEGILWVCGIRQAERTRITAQTTSVITFKQTHTHE